MAPAFGLVEAKGLVPHFINAATKVRTPFVLDPEG